PAPAPWDFPPPAFDLTDHDFPRATRALPARAPEDQWLYQTDWVRMRRATRVKPMSVRQVIVVADATSPPAHWKALDGHGIRVVHVTAGQAYARLAQNRYEVDPADPDSLTRLLEAVTRDAAATGGGVEWLHALPLGVAGTVGEQSLDRARHACLDAPSALCQALARLPQALRPRIWWLSHRAQPVTGPVQRPELGLLAGALEIPRQELGLETRWLDLPSGLASDWAELLSLVLAEPDAEPDSPADTAPRRLALRQGYWWRAVQQPVRPPAQQARTILMEGSGTHLVLGGTGGVGSTIATRLLEQSDARVVLLARRPQLPPALARWSDRITVVEADLAQEPLDNVLARLAPYLSRLDSIVHAVGTAAGGLLVRRDGDAMRHTTRAKLHGALLMERLIAAHRPGYAVYCSSMAAVLGGVGQFDYAAANGVLDAFAHHGSDDQGATVRIGIGWDVWRDVGMARTALTTDARHQAHLAAGLSSAEALRVFSDALQLQLPHLMVSTTPLEETRYFYEPDRHELTSTSPAMSTPAVPHGELAEAVCQLLGVDTLDPDTCLYDLGADSLTLLDLLSEVKRQYGVDIDLSRLSHQVTLNEVLTHLNGGIRPQDRAEDAADVADAVTVEVWQRGDGPEVLCLVHPIGGDIQAYRPLVSALDPRLTVCLIPDPALRDPGLPPWSVTQRAARYHSALRARFPDPDTRFRLAGWSFGAWVALSMASEAEAADRPVDQLYLLDPPPPTAGPLLSSYDEHDIRTVFEHELHGNGARSPLAGPGHAYAERLAHCCRVNLAGLAAHRPPRLTRTPSTLWLATRTVTDLPSLPVRQSGADDWARILPGSPYVHEVDATHYELVAGPHADHVARSINKDVS
ncbi:SDR family NAD(P)-dependent oxidoreductase, partial [Streptomyces milbemycinicus]